MTAQPELEHVMLHQADHTVHYVAKGSSQFTTYHQQDVLMTVTATAFPTTTSNEPRRIFELQRQHREQIRATTAQERIAKLKQLRAKITARQPAILHALHEDFRKPPVEADLAEVGRVIAEITYVIKNLRTWMRSKRVKTPPALFGTKSEIRYEPKGLSLIISPWNYPFTLTLGPLVGAVAAGCSVMIKPSEYTPHSAQLMQELLAEVFDEREVAVLQGDASVAQALLRLPFNHIYYTGSPEVGKLVMQAAAAHLASVTLELGGKSPTIVDETADIAASATQIASGKFFNCGQACIAPDYVIVHERVHDDFVAALRQQLNAFYGSTEAVREQTPNYARIVNRGHTKRIQQLYESAVADGAQVAIGGTVNSDERYIAPTVLTDVPLDTAIMQEEIFGPVLPVVKFARLDDALMLINSKPNPLVLYMFSTNEGNIEHVLNHTSAGGTCVNETLLHFLHPELPFGGAGYSGIGKGYGYHGFLAFTNERAVLKRTRRSPVMPLMYPPYGKYTAKLINFFVRYM